MKTKLEYAKEHYQQLDCKLACPICGAFLYIQENTLQCENKHTYNLNKKGVVSFSRALKDSAYNSKLFRSREIVLNSGIYDPVFSAIMKQIPPKTDILVDAGTGEGSYLNIIKGSYPHLQTIGLDLSKEGINIATQYTDNLWMIADLAKIPLQDSTVDVILNVLSPANYKEFIRILKEDGCLIKLIVNKDYLKEVRQLSDKETHDNRDVLDILRRNMDIIYEEDIFYKVAVEKGISQHLFTMTPMTQDILENNFEIEEISIDLKLIVAKKKA